MLAFQDDYPEKRPRGSEPPLRFITAALWGDDLDLTPLDPVLEIHGRFKEVKGRKVIVEAKAAAAGVLAARGEVVAVRMPGNFKARRFGQAPSRAGCGRAQDDTSLPALPVAPAELPRHIESSLRVSFLTSESYDGNSVEYIVIDCFVFTLQNQKLRVTAIDLEKKVFETPSGTLPFSAVRNTVDKSD